MVYYALIADSIVVAETTSFTALENYGVFLSVTETIGMGRSQQFFPFKPGPRYRVKSECLMQRLLEFDLEQVIPVLPLTINNQILFIAKTQS